MMRENLKEMSSAFAEGERQKVKEIGTVEERERERGGIGGSGKERSQKGEREVDRQRQTEIGERIKRVLKGKIWVWEIASPG